MGVSATWESCMSIVSLHFLPTLHVPISFPFPFFLLLLLLLLLDNFSFIFIIIIGLDNRFKRDKIQKIFVKVRGCFFFLKAIYFRNPFVYLFIFLTFV